MIDSALRNIYYANDSTQKLYSVQEESSQKMDEFSAPGFSQRFKETISEKLPGKNDREVADLLGVGKSAMTNYTSKDRVPKIAVLYKFRELTGVNFHWLLTGDESTGRMNVRQLKADILLKEKSLSEIFTNLFERLEKLEKLIPNLEKAELVTFAEPVENSTNSKEDTRRSKQKAGTGNSNITVPPQKTDHDTSHTQDFTVLIKRIQDENPEIGVEIIVAYFDDEFDDIPEDWMKIIQRHSRNYTPLETFEDDKDSNKSAHKKKG